ncbi:MAG: hypothetical protein WAK26_07620 [Terracidiphilus sp.]
MRKWIAVAGLVLLGALACPAQTANVAGEWRGVWTNPDGMVFSATMTLETGKGCKTCAVVGDGAVWGKIVWTLRKAGENPDPELAAKIGKTATELVKGNLKGDELLELNGYVLEDPAEIKGTDQYRLAISEDSKVLGGITLNGGSWTGQFIAMRQQPPEKPSHK